MTVSRLEMIVSMGLLGIACSSESGGPTTADAQAPLIRPTVTGGRDQVVELVIDAFQDGQLFSMTCSASYFAPRVLLTAAHCLDGAYRISAYWGDDYDTDYALASTSGVLEIPEPAQTTVWGAAESWESHPSWDPTMVYPDIGVVYLDREPPFEPLPLLRSRLGDWWIGKDVSIVGWGGDAAPSATSTTGANVERTGRTRILGSPTVADYHADDPNPGLLISKVRRDVVKTDGRAPYSNACFGDSGGPMLVNLWGREFITGVSYWTGLWCEDYSLYTRIDPFLPFLDAANRKGGRAPLVPTFECVAPSADGQYVAFFGYKNDNGVSVVVPFGASNQLALDVASRRPSHFLPGSHRFAFAVEFGPRQLVKYKLAPPNGPTTVLHASRASRACGPDEGVPVACGGYCSAFDTSGCEGLIPFPQCMDECVSFGESAGACQAQYNAMNTCYATTPEGPENWMCYPGYPYPMSLSCGEAESEFYACLFAGMQ